MKMQSLFDILQDAQDILSFFEGVTTTDQMISRLNRLKQQAGEDLFDTVESLRMSVGAALEDQMELGGSLGSPDSQDDFLGMLEDKSNDTEPFNNVELLPVDSSEPELSNPTTEDPLKEKVSS
jgi:hypothetical protein